MLDILRDKKTLIMMILVPIVLYPLLIIGMTFVLNSVMSTSEEVSYTVGFDKEYADVVSDLQEVMAQDPEEFEEAVEFLAMDEDFLYPIVCTTVDEVSEAESFGVSIGGSIGMMLIVMILMGALYPAIDTTAGEKERGTLETLLTLPVTNFQMIFSKFVSVAVIACVTALLSSALCMCFCVFAKSFKEANNYVTPLLLVVMIASMAGMLPSVELDQRTVLIPIVNVSLMMKQVLSQQFSFALAGVDVPAGQV